MSLDGVWSWCYLESIAALQVGCLGRPFVQQRVVRRNPLTRRSRGGFINDVAFSSNCFNTFTLAVVEKVVMRPEIDGRSAVRADSTERFHQFKRKQSILNQSIHRHWFREFYLPVKPNEQRVARRQEILTFQRFWKSIAKCFDDSSRVGFTSVVDCQRFAAVTRQLFNRSVRLADAESAWHLKMRIGLFEIRKERQVEQVSIIQIATHVGK